MSEHLHRVDRHHLWSPRRDYAINSPEYKLRTHRRSIFRLDYYVHHFQLHPNVEHPPMPTPELANEAISYLYLFDESVDKIESTLGLIKHLNQRSYLGGEIADNLLKQLTYIEVGYHG